MKSLKCIILIIIIASIACKKEEKTIQKLQIPSISTPWMSQLMEESPNEEIYFSDIFIPAAHDAGMYILRKCNLGANSCNTQTQKYDIKTQLEVGYRMFDIRPAKVGDKYYAQHTTSCGGLGCQGDFLKNILQYTNDYLENNNEVVIFVLSHFCRIQATDTIFTNMLQDILGGKIYKEIDNEPYFANWSLNKILGENPTHGKIILMFDEGYEDNLSNRRNGYFSSEIMQLVGGWSNKSSYEELKNDQLSKFKNYQPTPTSIFQFSYQLTQNETLAVSCALGQQGNSIYALSQQSNPDFPIVINRLIESHEILPQKIPNIFWCDYGDKWMIDIALQVSKIGLSK
ncbi:MAG: hypothetical protein M9958_12030 [Chitinophagales bacterium]|nr:hypothetical protein [Chitinophagales bacterium]